jgi:metal-responsive CopG/Arc/MetJ family transcriptional regulator
MGTARLNITLPKEIIEELAQVVGPRRKSQFIATIIRDRLNELRNVRLREELAEGYRTRTKESSKLAADFLMADLEGWDEY